MERSQIEELMRQYGIKTCHDIREIDSSKSGDYRLNIIVDRTYVLRINNPSITEERLEGISRLVARYRSIGVLAPGLFRNREGKFITPFDNKVCYVSQYLDYDTADKIYPRRLDEKVAEDLLTSIGRLSSKYSGVDLMPVNSMWSIIDLAPLDEGIDEKQENVNDLVTSLYESGDAEMAKLVKNFNDTLRTRIREHYKELPRCVIQGDLNSSNILVQDGKFIGIIDFNMAGTEVNINHFCSETNINEIWNDLYDRQDFNVGDFFHRWRVAQDNALKIILQTYKLNTLENRLIHDYRRIGLISQYPNVCFYKHLLGTNKTKAKELLELILRS